MKRECPCDIPPFICPYDAEYSSTCDYYCSEPEPEDWGYDEDMGFDPYMGCYTDDC